MFDFVVEYWTQIVFLTAILIYIYKQIAALRNGMKALLHEKIVQKCEYHLHQGFITSYDIDELECLNEPYRQLKGNGTAKALLHEVHELPKKKKDGIK